MTVLLSLCEFPSLKKVLCVKCNIFVAVVVVLPLDVFSFFLSFILLCSENISTFHMHTIIMENIIFPTWWTWPIPKSSSSSSSTVTIFEIKYMRNRIWCGYEGTGVSRNRPKKKICFMKSGRCVKKKFFSSSMEEPANNNNNNQKMKWKNYHFNSNNTQQPLHTHTSARSFFNVVEKWLVCFIAIAIGTYFSFYSRVFRFYKYSILPAAHFSNFFLFVLKCEILESSTTLLLKYANLLMCEYCVVGLRYLDVSILFLVWLIRSEMLCYFTYISLQIAVRPMWVYNFRVFVKRTQKNIDHLYERTNETNKWRLSQKCF